MRSIQIESLREWIGRQQKMTDPLNLFPARALAATFNHIKVPQAGDPLSACWHWLYFLETPSRFRTAADGHTQKGDFLPPVPLSQRMWASGSVDIHCPLRLGTGAEKTSTVQSVELKSGKSGPLVFVTVHHEMFQGGNLCIAENQTLVYRDAAGGSSVPLEGEPAMTTATWSEQVRPDPVLLFRFSALTYNSHRIHYDRDYATRQETYPGLVVHAPLLVTLLLDLALRENPTKTVKKFQFCAIRPTFDFESLQLRGRIEGQVVTLWSAGDSGYIGVKATATLGDDS